MNRLIPFWAALLLPLAFWPPFEDAFKLPQFAVIALLATWLVLASASRRMPAPPRAVVPASALLGGVMLSSIVGGHARFSDAATVASFIIAGLLLPGLLAREGRGERMLVLLMTAGVLSSLYSILQFSGLDLFPSPGTGAGLRPFSTMGNPDFLAVYLVAVLPLAGARWLQTRSVASAAAALAMLAALMLTQSRGAWLGLAASVVAIPLLARFSGRGFRITRGMAAGVAIAILGAGAFFAFHGAARDRLSRTFSTGHFDAAGRLFMWRATMDMVRERPLLGAGPGSYGRLYPEHHARLLKGNPSFPWFYSENAHDDYLQLSAEQGIAVFGLWIWIWLCWVKLAWSRFKAGEVWAGGLMAGFIAMQVDALFNFPWYLLPTQSWFWLSFALLAGGWRGQNLLHLLPSPRRGEGRVREAETTESIFAKSLTLSNKALPLPHAGEGVPGEWLKTRFNSLVEGLKMLTGVVFCAVFLFLLLRAFQSNAWLKLSGDYVASSRWPEGRAAAERSLDRWALWEGRARAANNAALAAYSMGDFTATERHARLSLSLMPGMPAALSQLGMALARAGNLSAAEEACRRAVEINPHLAEGWHALGNIAFLRGDRAASVRAWERAVAEDPRMTGARDSLAALKRGAVRK